ERASSGNPKSPYFRGFQAGSEPEVQAVLKLMETKRFFFSMSIHCYANSVLIPYSIPDTKNPSPNTLQELGEKLIQNVNSQREEEPFLAKKNLYPVDGTDQDTFYHDYGTFAYLLESSHLVENYLYVPIILSDIRPAWENLLKTNSQTYKWKIQVVNENNKPLMANIESSAYEYFHEERRVTNQYGKYNEVAPNSKVIQVNISVPGYKTKYLSINPEKNPKRQVVVMEKLNKNKQ
ncbi:MAG: peptidase M14, partial [Leptospira sp.]|nr:peptidase M14 [Leptospira sp.]